MLLYKNTAELLLWWSSATLAFCFVTLNFCWNIGCIVHPIFRALEHIYSKSWVISNIRKMLLLTLYSQQLSRLSWWRNSDQMHQVGSNQANATYIINIIWIIRFLSSHNQKPLYNLQQNFLLFFQKDSWNSFSWNSKDVSKKGNRTSLMSKESGCCGSTIWSTNLRWPQEWYEAWGGK